MNWFQILQANRASTDWRARADIRSLLEKIEYSAQESIAFISREPEGTFRFRQCSEAMKEMEGHFEAFQKLKSSFK